MFAALSWIWSAKWYLAVAALAIAFYMQRFELGHVRAELAAAQNTIARMDAAGRAQAANSAKLTEEAIKRATDLQAQLEAELAAHAVTGAKLADSVQLYETTRRRCAVSGK